MTGPRSPEVLLRPLDDVDPRLHAGEGALVLASRNAYPVVAATARRRGDGLGLAAGVGVALLLGGATFLSMSAHRAVPRPRVVTIPASVGSQAPLLPPLSALAAPRARPAAPFAAPVASPAYPGPSRADAARAPALVFDGSAPATTVATPAAAADPGRPTAPRAVGGEDDQFAARVGGEGTEVATAEHLSNPATTIAQGTLIPAVLETAIDTDLPGFVRAVVSRDVRSFDGAHVLVPRSSRLVGQYKSGLQAGQTRAYVIWQRLIRPDGVSVALASPAVDFSGRTGLAGDVDGHFMKRFGSAVLLSVVGSLGALGSGGTSVVLSGGGQSAASVAAGRDAQIPPTVRVPQGQPIRVFTARDLDFSTTDAG